MNKNNCIKNIGGEEVNQNPKIFKNEKNERKGFAYKGN